MAVNAYKIGSVGTDTTTGRTILTLLFLDVNDIAGNTGRCLQRNNANYQVTAGKTFYACGGLYWNSGAALAAGSNPLVRYADNAALTNNPVNLEGVPKAAIAVASKITVPYLWTVPAGKYLGLYNDSATATSEYPYYVLYGYEE